ncbi:MAG: hypothetical protein ACHP9Y_01300 [Gammaproteobacteria bacterium]
MAAMDFKTEGCPVQVIKQLINNNVGRNPEIPISTYTPKFNIPLCEEMGHSFMVTEWEKDTGSNIANVLLCQRCMGLYKYKEMKQRMKILLEDL